MRERERERERERLPLPTNAWVYTQQITFQLHVMYARKQWKFLNCYHGTTLLERRHDYSYA